MDEHMLLKTVSLAKHNKDCSQVPSYSDISQMRMEEYGKCVKTVNALYTKQPAVGSLLTLKFNPNKPYKFFENFKSYMESICTPDETLLAAALREDAIPKDGANDLVANYSSFDKECIACFRLHPAGTAGANSTEAGPFTQTVRLMV